MRAADSLVADFRTSCRAEERLHETTIMISNLSMQAVATVRLSSALEVFIEGLSVLRLLNPVGNFNQN